MHQTDTRWQQQRQQLEHHGVAETEASIYSLNNQIESRGEDLQIGRCLQSTVTISGHARSISGRRQKDQNGITVNFICG